MQEVRGSSPRVPTNFMSQIVITLPDGSERGVPSGTPVRDFAASALPLGVVKIGRAHV